MLERNLNEKGSVVETKYSEEFWSKNVHKELLKIINLHGHFA